MDFVTDNGQTFTADDLAQFISALRDRAGAERRTPTGFGVAIAGPRSTTPIGGVFFNARTRAGHSAHGWIEGRYQRAGLGIDTTQPADDCWRAAWQRVNRVAIAWAGVAPADDYEPTAPAANLPTAIDQSIPAASMPRLTAWNALIHVARNGRVRDGGEMRALTAAELLAHARDYVATLTPAQRTPASMRKFATYHRTAAPAPRAAIRAVLAAVR